MSEIRVNSIVAAEGTSAPNLPYGVQVPTGMGITGAGGVNITGVVTATSFSGSGASLTGIAVTENVRTNTITVSGVSTFTGASNFSAAVNVDATTDSTSATSGALIVDGGLGVAKNVYIGAGLSVAGTLTYEDVTNVDSVGLITAKSGVNITGGQLQVGAGFSVGAAGVGTFAGNLVVNGDIDLEGDIDVNGTMEADAITVNGSTLASVIEGTTVTNATNSTTATNANHVLVTDNESTNENNLITFVEDATSSTGNVGLEMDGNLTYNPSTGRLTATQLAGTLQTATQSNITEIGTLGALTISGAGELKVGTAFTMASTAGVATFSKNVVFTGLASKSAVWNTGNGAFELNDDTALKIGNGADLKIYHDGSNSYIDDAGTGSLKIRSGTDSAIVVNTDDSVQIYWDGSERIRTTGAGQTCVGVSTFQDFSSYGMLKERVNIVANKLSAGTNIDLEKGNIWYYTTNETTTATPNIRYNSSYTLNNKMVIGETVTVSIISKPNNAGYYANMQVDGQGQTEEWNGGSAPSSANSGGYDVTVHQITKTGDAGWLVLSNVSNFA